MSIPNELEGIVKVAANSVSVHPRGELSLSYRRQIWAALGPRLVDEKERAIYGIGLARRTKLAILCVQKVMPLWVKALPDNNWPQNMIIFAEQYLEKKIDYHRAKREKDEFWTHLDDLVCKREDQLAISVGYAAAKVVTTALRDEQFDPNRIDESAADNSMDPDQWDTGYLAAKAFSGLSTQDDNFTIAKRRQFWFWYLNEAVPLAWSHREP